MVHGIFFYHLDLTGVNFYQMSKRWLKNSRETSCTEDS